MLNKDSMKKILNSAYGKAVSQTLYYGNRYEKDKAGFIYADTLYTSSDWDGGIGFDYIRNIKYCPICGKNCPNKGEYMDEKALKIVKEYIVEHLDKSDILPNFEVFTVWKSKVLQNWKYLISSTLFDGMYYELTYNGDKKEWYLDAYKKFENRVVTN